MLGKLRCVGTRTTDHERDDDVDLPAALPWQIIHEFCISDTTGLADHYLDNEVDWVKDEPHHPSGVDSFSVTPIHSNLMQRTLKARTRTLGKSCVVGGVGHSLYGSFLLSVSRMNRFS